MEKVLRESEARNRAMVEAIPDLMFVQDRAGVYLDYHTNKPELLLTPPDFFLGRTNRDVLPPAQFDAIQLKFDLAFETGEMQTHEYTLDLANGTYHFETRMNTYGDDRLLSIVRDVTERKQAEVELQYTKVGLEKANQELQTALAREHELAHTDSLTGINNRRYLYELAEHEFEIALRYQRPLSILMFDIDHFKRVNDTFGHTAGDRILQQVTQVTCAQLRSADVIGRYGGEEFVVVLPMTNAQQAYPLAERIRLAAEGIRVPTEKGDATVTLSIGIVEIQQGAQTGSVESMIRRADEVMYAAKQAGRNRTEIGG
jgi:diguanylate cyclase (GGDEF)-like protein/PAS domain S-box-containing protein